MGIGNHIKTAILLGALTGLLLGAGQLLGGRMGLLIGLIFAGGMNIFSFWFSDKIVLKMYRAKESHDHELNKIVREIAHLANIPMPKVYIVPSMQPNAFATGRSPKHAAVACTTGILKILNKSELKGVLAHELAHIKNRDTLITTIAATIAGVISYLAMMAKWGAIFGGFGRDRDSGSMIQLIALAIVTPLIALVLQLAISRSREYLADETGARTIHDAHALASALEKLDNAGKHIPMGFGNQATSSLFISNPFRAKNLFALLSTHPPMHKRIEKLKSMDV